MGDVGNKTDTEVTRPERSQLYMETARTFSKRSTCRRKAVGAVLVRDTHILGVGYNGAARNQDDCLGVGCLLMAGHCVRTVHAEVNAVLSAAYNGVSTKGATLYTTTKPCFRCRAFLINAGVIEVFYDEEYDDGLNNTEQGMIKIRKWNDAGTEGI